VAAGTLFHRVRPWARLCDVPILHIGDLTILLVSERVNKPEQGLGDGSTTRFPRSAAGWPWTGFLDGNDRRFTATRAEASRRAAALPLHRRGRDRGRLRRLLVLADRHAGQELSAAALLDAQSG
jgi:hypothetical protein